MKHPPRIKDIATASGVKYQTVFNTLHNGTRSRQMPEILCASCALYNERRATGKDLMDEMHEQGGLNDALAHAFALQFQIPFTEGRELLGFMHEVQSKFKEVEVCEVAKTKRLGVHISFDVKGLYFQAHANGFDMTLYVGHLPFKGSIDELITVLSTLLK